MNTDKAIRSEIAGMCHRASPDELMVATYDTADIDSYLTHLKRISLETQEKTGLLAHTPYLVVTELPADKPLITAITGNGPHSEANARLFSISRKVIEALIEDIDELTEELAAADRDLTLLRNKLVMAGIKV